MDPRSYICGFWSGIVVTVLGLTLYNIVTDYPDWVYIRYDSKVLWIKKQKEKIYVEITNPIQVYMS